MIREFPSARRVVEFIASAEDDLAAMPQPIKNIFGFALFKAELGDKHADAKPLKGFGGAGVLEVVENHDGNTYRAVYTVKFKGAATFSLPSRRSRRKARRRRSMTWTVSSRD